MTGYEEALRHRVEKLEAKLIAVRKRNEELEKIIANRTEAIGDEKK